MAKMDERVDMIGSSILAQAEHERKSLIEKAVSIRVNEMKEFEERIIQDFFGKVQKQASGIRVDSVKAVSAAKVTAHRELLRRREEYLSRVFASVRARLFDHVKTGEYKAAVKAELASISQSWDHSYSTVYLREADMDMAGEIKEILKGCEVVPDRAIKHGGWKLTNSAAKILIDETLETRLDAQKSWFLLNSGLEIDKRNN